MVTGGLGAFGDRFRHLDRRTHIELPVCPCGLELERDVESGAVVRARLRESSSAAPAR